MIEDITCDKFVRSKFDLLSKMEQKKFLLFCDACHINVGISSEEQFIQGCDILLGEHRSGNTNAIGQLKEMIKNAIVDRQLSAKKGFEILNRIDV